MFTPIEVVVLAEIFCICVICDSPPTLLKIKYFIWLRLSLFVNPSRTILFHIFSRSPGDFHIDQLLLYLAFYSPFTSTKEQKDFLLEVKYLGDTRKGIDGPDDKLLVGLFSVTGTSLSSYPSEIHLLLLQTK